MRGEPAEPDGGAPGFGHKDPRRRQAWLPVDVIQGRFQKPVLRVDEPMAGVRGRRIGVAATLLTTLEPTSDLLRRKAQEAGKEVDDVLVSKAMINKLGEVDVIVLAQASMARVVDRLPRGALTAPVLSSPPLAMEYVRERLARLRPN
jgi:hypothetical protein